MTVSPRETRSPKPTPRVLVVILNWNGADDTLRCLDSLAHLDHPSFDILVVDNASTDHSIDRLRELAASGAVLLMENSSNLGFAGGVNVGIRFAITNGYTSVALLNNDAIPLPDWLSQLEENLDSSDAAISTGLLLDSSGSHIDSSGDFYSAWGMPYPRGRGAMRESAAPSGPVFAASGGASLYRTSLFEDIGLFDEVFFAYFEDVDLSFRARLRGHEVSYTRDAVAHHERGATSGRVSGLTTYQTFKNLPLLYWRNLPTTLALRMLPRFSGLYCALLANAIRRRKAGPALRGALEASHLLWTHALPTRREIQRTRTASVRSIARWITPRWER